MAANKHTIVLQTPRLDLRQLRWDDLEDFVALYGDPDVMRHISGTPYQRQETQAHLQRYLEMEQKYGFGLWAAIYRDNGQFIGRCGLIPQEIEGVVEVEIAYMLAKAYWQRGLATEAALAIRNYGFQRLGYNRLISLIDPQNQASMRVAAKIGGRYEQEIYKWNRRIFLFSMQASDRLGRLPSHSEEIEKLRVQLYDSIYRNWTHRPTFTQQLNYEVTLNSDGTIVGYKPVGALAQKFLLETPLPKLAKLGNNEKSVTKFQVSFKPTWTHNVTSLPRSSQ